MGQGDAHIIECEMTDRSSKDTYYEYAFVDLGTSSEKTGEVAKKIWDIIKWGVVSNVFLTHPDKDHISYLEWVNNYPIFSVINVPGKLDPPRVIR